MFSSKLLRTSTCLKRSLQIRSSSCKGSGGKKFKVTVVGAAGGIGQPLSLLLKLNPAIGELRLHDIANTPGVAADLSHIETASKVTHFIGKELCNAVQGTDIIVCPAGMPRKPGMKREDLFNANAQVAVDVAQALMKAAPEAVLLLITNPVNTMVPIACELMKAGGKFNPAKIFGVSTLDAVRAATFIAELSGNDPKDVNIPMVGGHSGTTIIPLISRSSPKVCLQDDVIDKVTKRIQDAGTEVVKAKAGKGSATLSMAYAGSRMTFSIIKAMSGEQNIVECAYVYSDVHPELRYLATPLLLGKGGIEKNLGLGKMNEYEEKLFCAAIPQLKKDIQTGVDFAKKQGGPCAKK